MIGGSNGLVVVAGLENLGALRAPKWWARARGLVPDPGATEARRRGRRRAAPSHPRQGRRLACEDGGLSGHCSGRGGPLRCRRLPPLVIRRPVSAPLRGQPEPDVG